MQRPEVAFAQRLATARKMIAGGWTGSILPDHMQDQVEAAADECEDQLHHLGFVVANVDPERGWRQRSRDAAPEQRAYLLAAMLDCMRTLCPHLRKEPQPAYAMLPLRRLDRRRCVHVRRLPPVEDVDRCDVCGTRSVTVFVSFAVAIGPTLVSGDACPSCAGVLDIGKPAA